MKTVFWPDFSGYRNIELGLSRVYQLLERLDNPHLKIPPTIHLAGTNGKGSTLSFLKQIFVESGLKVHTYTSPHLVNFNERITLANKEISDDFLNECLATCQKASELEPKIPVTFFEGITVAAFLAFSKIKADILLLETGMGGRLDATNVLPQVIASIITPISFDHVDFLGKTLGKIAHEKAGIIKKNCPVFIAKQKKSALHSITKQASSLNAKTFIFGDDFKVTKNKNCFYLHFNNTKILLPNPTMEGEHQVENAALAVIVALTQKQFVVDLKNISTALHKTFWPARLQKIKDGKFYQLLPSNYQLYLDGSHNLQGSLTIKKFLTKHHDHRKIIIFSMLQDKDCKGFLSTIATEVDELLAITIPNEEKSLRAEEIKEVCDKIGIKATVKSGFDDAFLEIKNSNRKEKNLIMVCGSLYLAGSLLAQNQMLEH